MDHDAAAARYFAACHFYIHTAEDDGDRQMAVDEMREIALEAPSPAVRRAAWLWLARVPARLRQRA